MGVPGPGLPFGVVEVARVARAAWNPGAACRARWIPGCATLHPCYFAASPRYEAGRIGHSLRSMKVAEVLTLLKDDGWYLVAIRGSHRQFKHRLKSGRVTVAGKSSDDVAPGTLNSILKQAGLKPREV